LVDPEGFEPSTF